MRRAATSQTKLCWRVVGSRWMERPLGGASGSITITHYTRSVLLLHRIDAVPDADPSTAPETRTLRQGLRARIAPSGPCCHESVVRDVGRPGSPAAHDSDTTDVRAPSDVSGQPASQPPGATSSAIGGRRAPCRRSRGSCRGRPARARARRRRTRRRAHRPSRGPCGAGRPSCRPSPSAEGPSAAPRDGTTSTPRPRPPVATTPAVAGGSRRKIDGETRSSTCGASSAGAASQPGWRLTMWVSRKSGEGPLVTATRARTLVGLCVEARTDAHR